MNSCCNFESPASVTSRGPLLAAFCCSGYPIHQLLLTFPRSIRVLSEPISIKHLLKGGAETEDGKTRRRKKYHSQDCNRNGEANDRWQGISQAFCGLNAKKGAFTGCLCARNESFQTMRIHLNWLPGTLSRHLDGPCPMGAHINIA